jgi:hypothetical protein
MHANITIRILTTIFKVMGYSNLNESEYFINNYNSLNDVLIYPAGKLLLTTTVNLKRYKGAFIFI